MTFAIGCIEVISWPPTFHSATWTHAMTVVFIKEPISTVSTNIRVTLALTNIIIKVISRTSPAIHSVTRIGIVVIFTFADIFVEVSVDAVSIDIRITLAIANICVEVISRPPTLLTSTRTSIDTSTQIIIILPSIAKTSTIRIQIGTNARTSRLIKECSVCFVFTRDTGTDRISMKTLTRLFIPPFMRLAEFRSGS